MVEDLTRLTELLDKKVSQDGIEGAAKWSAKLSEWADRLQPPKPENAGEEGAARVVAVRHRPKSLRQL